MPGGDGTGPRGLGPGTGWGYGPCGRGRFFRRRFFGRFYSPIDDEPLTNEEEKQMLEQEVKSLEEELKRIREKLKERE